MEGLGQSVGLMTAAPGGGTGADKAEHDVGGGFGNYDCEDSAELLNPCQVKELFPMLDQKISENMM